MRYENLVTRKLDARLRAADALLDIMQAQAEAREDRDELAEVFSLRTASEDVRRKLAGLEDPALADRTRARRVAEAALRELEGAMQKARGQYAEQEGVGLRHLNALLDQAEAMLRLWRARIDVEAAERDLELYDVVLTVQEGSALANARDADLLRERYDRKAQEALEEATRHLGEAFAAAAKRHEVRQEQ